MSDEERLRCQCLRFERDRRLYCATRLLCRYALSHYYDTPPAKWRFARTASGKPIVTTEGFEDRLFFNLSNTPGLVVAAVSCRHSLLGIDAEKIEHGKIPFAAGEIVFSALELEELNQLPENQRPRRFISLWTLKESFIKALGLGIAKLDHISFRVQGDRIAAAIAPQIEFRDMPWTFRLYDLSPDYLVALSIGGPASPVVRVINFSSKFD